MQLWRIPKSGKYKVICYGAKGGDSIYTRCNEHLSGGFGSKVGSIFKLFENDIIKIVSDKKDKIIIVVAVVVVVILFYIKLEIKIQL